MVDRLIDRNPRRSAGGKPTSIEDLVQRRQDVIEEGKITVRFGHPADVRRQLQHRDGLAYLTQYLTSHGARRARVIDRRVDDQANVVPPPSL